MHKKAFCLFVHLLSYVSENIKKSFDRFCVASFYAISRLVAHILMGAQNAKEEVNMEVQANRVGDVDDLIFQDHWITSDR